MNPTATKILHGGLAVAVVILVLLFAAVLAFDAAADAEYRAAGFRKIDGKWVP